DTTMDAGATNDITLDQENNDFSLISITSDEDRNAAFNLIVVDVNDLSLGRIDVTNDVSIRTGGSLDIMDDVTSTAGKVRLEALNTITQQADISANVSAKVFSDTAPITMHLGTKSTSPDIVYTGFGDVTVATLDAGNGTAAVTSENGSVVGADNKDKAAHFVGVGSTVDVYGLGPSGAVGEFDRPLRFEQLPGVMAINVAHNSNAYLDGEGINIITAPITVLNFVTYEGSGNLQIQDTATGVDIVVSNNVSREQSAQAQAIASEQFVETSSALLKPRIKIYNLIGTALRLPEHQLEEDELNEDELDEQGEEDELTEGEEKQSLDGEKLAQFSVGEYRDIWYQWSNFRYGIFGEKRDTLTNAGFSNPLVK
ncbi:MAG: hypothetical protein GY703_06250, partial [Gammaproteobacteria bacterium]|nr:hypothetical protein [Gammaproteobacteria bacterium]